MVAVSFFKVMYIMMWMPQCSERQYSVRKDNTVELNGEKFVLPKTAEIVGIHMKHCRIQFFALDYFSSRTCPATFWVGLFPATGLFICFIVFFYLTSFCSVLNNHFMNKWIKYICYHFMQGKMLCLNLKVFLKNDLSLFFFVCVWYFMYQK